MCPPRIVVVVSAIWPPVGKAWLEGNVVLHRLAVLYVSYVEEGQLGAHL